MYTPKRVTKTVTRHEFRISTGWPQQITARDLADTMAIVQNAVEEKKGGRVATSDDAFYVRVEDDDIVLYFTTEKEE